MSKMFSKATSAFNRLGEKKGEQQPQKPQQAQPDEEGESLTTILNPEERSSLTILIAECADAMRQSIDDTFDPNQTGKDSDQIANISADSAPAPAEVDTDAVDAEEQEKLQEEKKKEQEKIERYKNMTEEEQKKDQEKIEKEEENMRKAEEKEEEKIKKAQEKDQKQREKELSEPKMLELKEEALKYFDEWKTNVIQRVGEVVNSKEEKEHREKKEEIADEDAEVKAAERSASPPMRFQDPPEFDKEVGRTLVKLYPPVDNPLKQLDEKKRKLILHSMLLLMLSLENYQAHSRTLMVRLLTSLDLPISALAHDESKIARGLLAAAEAMNADSETEEAAKKNSNSRKWKVGLASVAGAALIGVTGGLAAPILAAGVGSVFGAVGLGSTVAATYLGSLAGSTMLVGGLFGAYGGRMTGQMMDQYAREVQDFAFIPVRTAHKPRKIEKEFRRLRVAIGISGWLNNKDDVTEPWKIIGIAEESFALRWELEALMNLGNAMTSIIKSAAWGFAKREIISRTIFASLSAGLWPIGLVKASRVIDNPWSVANYRAQKAGEVLADALINKAQGERPVTLVGYSLGAKVIYTCLHRLAERRAFGLVESAVLIGAPTPSDAADWRLLRSVVTGRLVNVYSTQDYVLGFLYRSSSIQYGVAGLQPIENVKGVENFDVSDKVTGHTSYRFLTGPILKQIGFEDVDAVQVEENQKQFEEEKAKEEEQLDENAAKDKAKKAAKGATKAAKTAKDHVSEDTVKELEKEIEEKNKQSYMDWASEKMVSAGSTAGVAYENAKTQWTLRSSNSAGDTDKVADPVDKTANTGVAATATDCDATQGATVNSDSQKAAS